MSERNDERDDRPKQKTRPRKKGAKPIHIPVPKRQDFERLIERAARPSPTRRTDNSER